MGYRERVCKFGSHGGLIGILTEPSVDILELAGNRPAIVVSNIGLKHRPGPNRMWVEFARRMAESGFITLRFDLSGLGDSASRFDNLSITEQHVADMREAVQFVLQKKQLSRVALVGLCSGVDPAHAVSLEDPRVSHAIFLDGYHYDTSRHLINIKFLKLIQPRYYARALRRWFLSIPVKSGANTDDEILTREYPSREKMREDIDAMLHRGVNLYFGFTGGFAYYYSYKDQFFDMLPGGANLRGKIKLMMFPSTDHLFCGVKLKENLYQSLEHFLLVSDSADQPSFERVA